MTQKFYAITKDGKISEHRLLYTDKEAAQTEMEGMQQAHNTPWSARLKGAVVAEVEVVIGEVVNEVLLYDDSLYPNSAMRSLAQTIEWVESGELETEL